MFSFANDYSEGAHPKILEAMCLNNLQQNTGYGLDIHCEQAKELIKREIKREDVQIHFIPGGTQTNLLAISSVLRPYQSVIAADTGHINVHETGAIEATGHKVITVLNTEGKLKSEQIEEVVRSHKDEHMVQPKMVYISNTTELGTIYTKEELSAISRICRQHGLYLFLDGARLASALTCRQNDLQLEDIAQLTDLFYIGGTKNGALLGEALVLCNQELFEDFRYLIKNRGAMMAKGFIMGIQFETLFQDGLYYELGEHANEMAEQIAKAFQNKKISFYVPPCTNQLFPILTEKERSVLEKEFIFQLERELPDKNYAVRFVTSWATTAEGVQKLIKAIEEL